MPVPTISECIRVQNQ